MQLLTDGKAISMEITAVISQTATGDPKIKPRVFDDIKGAEYDGEYTKKKKLQLGEKRFNSLMIQAHTPKKRDDKMDKMILEEKIRRIKRTK